MPSPGVGMVTIETDLKAQIDIVSYPLDEVGVDYLTQGWGGSDELAASEAHKQVAVTLERVAGGVFIWGRLLTPDANAQDRLSLLHVRVPHSASLVVKATKGGDITVSGEVRRVHAHTAEGTITVRGATGPVQLTTEKGNINVDMRSDTPGQVQRLELHARDGSLNVISVGASVLADTTNGNIFFVGSLFGHDNKFSTTGAGKVVMALPSDISYRFEMDGHGTVVNDFMPASLICAMIPNANSGLSTRPSPDVMGQIIASDPFITPTYSFKSVAGLYQAANQPARPYLYFQTSHSQIVRNVPAGDTPSNGGNTAQAWWPPECEVIKQQIDAQPPAVQISITAGTGRVLLRLNRKH